MNQSSATSVGGNAAAVPDGITEDDLQFAFNAEFSENDIFPPADITEDWFKLIDYDPENVVKIAPARAAAAGSAPKRSSGVI